MKFFVSAGISCKSPSCRPSVAEHYCSKGSEGQRRKWYTGVIQYTGGPPTVQRTQSSQHLDPVKSNPRSELLIMLVVDWHSASANM